MMKTNRTIIFSISLLTLFHIFTNRGTKDTSDVAEKIAFLREGEVWTSNPDGHGLKQVTNTGGKIDEFFFSPDLRCLAYAKIVKYAPEPGLWEKGEKIPERAVCSIVIVELPSKKVLKETPPPEDSWIYIAKWIGDGKLLCYRSSGFDVEGFFEYDIEAGKEDEIEYTKGSLLSDAYFHKDGSLMAYVDDEGVGKEFKQKLHIVDMNTKADKVIVSKRSILDPCISNNKKNVTFVEVEYVEKKGVDNLWVCDITGNFLRKLFTGPAKAKVGGVSELSWSLDDQYIGMFFPPEGIVIDPQNPDTIQEIHGSDFCWTSDNSIIFTQDNNISLYRLETRRTELLIKNAAKPVFLQKTVKR